MKYKNGDLLDSGADVIAHCCNCQSVMGSGVAKAIRTNYLRAYQVDLSCQLEPEDRLGTFTKSVGVPTIYNLYGQLTFASEIFTVAVDYDALRSSLQLMVQDLKSTGFSGTIGLPKLGAGLAGGDWSVIEKMLDEELDGFDVTVWCI